MPSVTISARIGMNPNRENLSNCFNLPEYSFFL